MLHELHISDLGVIADLDLELHAGLNVLTGETGAGKTMVTVGLSLAAGARASAQLVRSGAAAAKVQARFDAPEGAEAWADEGEVVLARTVTAEGRGSARIGGELTTASALATLGGRLLELHGQHQSLRLMETSTQTAFLDRFAGDEHLVALVVYREADDALRLASAALAELDAVGRDRERELDLLAYQVQEIRGVDPQPEETERLTVEEARLAHVERLLELSTAVEGALAEDRGGADAVAAAAAGLAGAADVDPAAVGLAERARSAAAEISELARDVRGYREALAIDPERLLTVRDRLAALRGLQRKYGDTEADVLAFLAGAEERLAALTGADDRREALTAEVEELRRERERRAAVLTRGRTAAAAVLAPALGDELVALGMPNAAIEVALEELDALGPLGAERVELRFSAGPAQPPLPLARTASGGELSRLMLACRSVLADLDDVPTLVFDEVDAGIGGEAGLAVGRRLARLAATRQVLVVTHLPQIACFADRHVRVRKDDRGVASIEVVTGEERVRELSRMLAGLGASGHARSHAEELLVQAAAARSPA